MNAAVLFIVFNRPATTRRVFEAIRAARPPRLYVAADGPRAGRGDEAARCADVRAIATAVDWPCELHTLFRDQNLGCKLGVSSGIDWFFEHEPEGIILEDDVLPLPGFFRFCEDLLAFHRDDGRISMISGCSFVGRPAGSDGSYVLTRYMHVWGWASWRRAWRHYDVTMAGWPETAAAARLAEVVGNRADAIDYWSTQFSAVARGEIDTWDYQWVFSAWMANMVAIMPTGMLVENLGFGSDATHTSGGVPKAVRDSTVADISFPLKHPLPGSTTAVDVLVERAAFDLTMGRRIRRLARQIPGVSTAVARYRSARGGN